MVAVVASAIAVVTPTIAIVASAIVVVGLWRAGAAVGAVGGAATAIAAVGGQVAVTTIRGRTVVEVVFVDGYVGFALARMIGLVAVIDRCPGVTHIVRMAVVRVVVWVGMMPAGLMHMVMVGRGIVGSVMGASVGIVGWDAPNEGGHGGTIAEAKVGGCIVEPVVGPHEPDATEVDGHVDFLARPGIVAVKPNFIVL